MTYLEKLKGLREDADLTQTDIAEILHISQTATQNMNAADAQYQLRAFFNWHYTIIFPWIGFSARNFGNE